MKKLFLMILPSVLLLASCKTAYYGAMEKVGFEKRDILVDRVGGARDSQDAAKEQFSSALEQFQSVVDFDGGSLEKKYNKLDKAYQKSVTRADDVNKRIAAVESVSKDLFKEWKSELKSYSSAELRRSSQQQLNQTQNEFDRLMTTMHDAAAKMDPVLRAFQDQVLFLKHNLNSQAITSIQTEAKDVSRQIEELIKDMEASIAEADSFIQGLGK